jgi:TolA-binding protein
VVALALTILSLAGPQEGEVDRILLRFNQRREKARSAAEFRKILEETRADLDRFLRESPGHKDAPRARLHSAESLLAAGQVPEALERLRALVKDFPDSESAASARFAIGEALLQKEDDPGARAAFEEFARVHPKDERAVFARIYAAVTHQNEGSYARAEEQLLGVRREFRERPESWSATMQLAIVYHVQQKNLEARRTLEEVIRDCPDREAVQAARRHLEAYLKVGQDPPAFSEKDLSGADVALEPLRGRVVVVYFFDSSLTTAVPEAAFLRKARDAFKPEELQIVGVSLDLDRKDLVLLRDSHRLSWPLLWDGKGYDGKLARLYDVRLLPSLTVLDRKGKIRFFNLAGKDLRFAIARLLEEK